MKKIERINIKGFQSHFNTDLVLTPGVNILIGPSYSGKSAVLRAIRWVFRNEPKGDSFINASFSESNEACEATITFTDGSAVERRKGTGVNRYRLLQDSKEIFKADNFGTGVPLEILRAIEMTDAYTWNELNIDLNFSNQFDAPFLLSETARVPALVFGKLIGLERIDGATKLTGRQKHEQQSICTSAQTEIDTLRQKLTKFPDIAKADVLLERASQKHLDVYMPLVAKGKTLVKLYTDFNEGEQRIVALRPAVQKERGLLARLITTTEDLQTLDRQERALQTLYAEYEDARKRIEFMSAVLEHPGLQRLVLVPELIEKLAAVSPRIDRLQDLGINIEKAIRDRNRMKVMVEHQSLQKLTLLPGLVDRLTAIDPRINRLRDIGTAFEGATKDREQMRFSLNESIVSLEFRKRELEGILSQMGACPLSGGEFFQVCKDTIKQGD